MLHHLPKVLTEAHLKSVRDIFAESKFIDGRLSAGQMAKAVKNNLEFDSSQRTYHLLNELVMGQLSRHGKYQRCAFAVKVGAPLYIKYGTGMTYGNHVDNPLMGEGPFFRCDVALTLFLNKPEDYDGGELVVTTDFGEQSIKLEAGDAVMYPASSLHRVNPVTRGERMVAVVWLQSMIRSPQRRHMLSELSRVRDELMGREPEAAQSIDQVYVNLVRLWAQV